MINFYRTWRSRHGSFFHWMIPNSFLKQGKPQQKQLETLWIECFQFCITGQAAGAVLWWRWIPPHTKGLLFFMEWLLSSVDVKVWTQFSDKPHAAFLLAVRLFAIRVSGALGASFLRSEMMVYLQQKKKRQQGLISEQLQVCTRVVWDISVIWKGLLVTHNCKTILILDCVRSSLCSSLPLMLCYSYRVKRDMYCKHRTAGRSLVGTLIIWNQQRWVWGRVLGCVLFFLWGWVWICTEPFQFFQILLGNFP